MTEEQNTRGRAGADGPAASVEPARVQTPAHPRPSDEGGEDAAADERTSPFPYAEKFDEWVADETAASDGRQHRRETGEADD